MVYLSTTSSVVYKLLYEGKIKMMRRVSEEEAREILRSTPLNEIAPALSAGKRRGNEVKMWAYNVLVEKYDQEKVFGCLKRRVTLFPRSDDLILVHSGDENPTFYVAYC